MTSLSRLQILHKYDGHIVVVTPSSLPGDACTSPFSVEFYLKQYYYFLGEKLADSPTSIR
jgi:hypothetical protein